MARRETKTGIFRARPVKRFGWCIIENGLLRTPNLANFLRILALPAEVAQWSLSTLRDRLVEYARNPRKNDDQVDRMVGAWGSRT